MACRETAGWRILCILDGLADTGADQPSCTVGNSERSLRRDG
jgi:hypothetical protein